jgi:hypothetical protein
MSFFFAAMLTKLFSNLSLSRQILNSSVVSKTVNQQFVRSFKFVDKPQIGHGKQFRRIVHFPEDNKYTVKPLVTLFIFQPNYDTITLQFIKIKDNTHLAGRDPVSGRKVVNGLGGGVKHKYGLLFETLRLNLIIFFSLDITGSNMIEKGLAEKEKFRSKKFSKSSNADAAPPM